MQTSVAPSSHASCGAVGDLVDGQPERVRVPLALGERAEPAADVADVREVDVAVDHVGDVVADHLGAQLVGEPGHRLQRRAVGGEQRHRRVACRPAALAGVRLGEPECHVRRPPAASRRPWGRVQRRPVAVDAVEVAAAVLGAPLGVDGGVQVGAAVGVEAAVRLLPLAADDRGVRRSASPSSRGQRGDVRGEAGVDPLPGGRASRSAGRRRAARAGRSRPRGSCAASASTCGHGRSGLTWSGVTGDTPPQSSMPARSIRPNSSPTRFGGACTLTDDGIDQPGHRDRGGQLVQVGVGHAAHRRVRLGAEVLDDHFLDVPVLPGDRRAWRAATRRAR